MPEKVKICQYCKRSLKGEKVNICPLCKSILCAYDSKPEDHHCERVDWKGMDKDREDFEQTKWDRFRDVIKDENAKRFWKNVFKWVGWAIISILILILALWNPVLFLILFFAFWTFYGYYLAFKK